MIVPTFDIDLLWHTHILHSMAGYHEDCRKIRGSPFHHNDSFYDQTPGGSLDQAFMATLIAWQIKYGKKYAVDGFLYLGRPPPEYSTGLWQGHHGVDNRNNGDDAATTTTAPWLSPHNAAATLGELPFIPAKIDGAYNPQRKGYVFGYGLASWGYYSMATKDAYVLLLPRLIKQEKQAQERIGIFDIPHCFCCLGYLCMSNQEVQQRVSLEVAHAKAQYMVTYTKAWLAARTAATHHGGPL